MIAAIYACKSTDDSEKDPVAKSTQLQIDGATAYAAKQAEHLRRRVDAPARLQCAARHARPQPALRRRDRLGTLPDRAQYCPDAGRRDANRGGRSRAPGEPVAGSQLAAGGATHSLCRW